MRAMADPGSIRVEVAVAWPELQVLIPMELPSGATVGEAIKRSGLRERFPELEIRDDRVGVFAEKRALTDSLRDGDRVEIYRPLKIDPRTARRLKASRSANSASADG